MSRVIYNEGGGDYADLRWGRWERNSQTAVYGKPGQRKLRELEAALLALPRKRLIAGELSDGEDVCALGCMLTAREMPVDEVALLSPADDWEADFTEAIAARLGMTFTLAWVIQELNDESTRTMTPERRYDEVLRWVRSNLEERA